MKYSFISENRFSVVAKAIKSMALAALLFSFSGCSGDDYEIFCTIHGTVTDYQTGAPIEKASVVLSPSGITLYTNAQGEYRFEELEAQQYTVTVQKAGYMANRKNIEAISGESTQVDIQLVPIPGN
ncbi:MAG: carboxypeptidase regulatory-like domain-containing protein [Coprobacter sp.]|nr:carboxypeptidase regulatory-like domain-containing protein [Coprobacter sp.]